MTDVADLGIQIDFSSAKAAGEVLDKMEGSGKKAAAGVSILERAWTDLVKGLAAYDILKKVALVLLEQGEKALFAGEQYSRLAAIAGTTASAISAFEEPARKSGVALDSIAAAIAKLGRSIGEARLGDQNQKLLLGVFGISPNDSRDAAAIFQDVGRTLISMKDQTVASALAFPLLGRSLAELKPALKEMVEQGTLHARMTDEQVRQSKRLADNIALIKLQAEDAALSLTSKLTPALNSFLEGWLRGKQLMATESPPTRRGQGLRGLYNNAVQGGGSTPFTGNFVGEFEGLGGGGAGAGGEAGSTAEAAGRKLLSDQKLYEARIAEYKGFTDQYMTYVKAFSALIEAEDNQSVHAQEERLAKQQQLSDAALQYQIANLQEERALAKDLNKTKEVAEFTAAIEQLNAQRITNEIITSAKIRAIQSEDLAKGLADYRAYVAKVENAGVDLATTQRETEERAYADRQQSLDVALKAGLISEEQAAAARLRLAQQTKQNTIAIAQEEWKGRVVFANLTNRDLIAINDNLFGVLAGLMNSGSKRMFEIGKVASIANALIKTYEAANNAFATGAAINPFLGYAFMAAAIVAGLANVQKINAIQFGGGSSGGGGATSFAPGVGVGVTPTVPATAPPGVQPGGGITVIVQGNFLGTREFLDDVVIPAIQDATNNKDTLLFGPNSRQATVQPGVGVS